jgi:acetoin utilization protein AcuB
MTERKLRDINVEEFTSPCPFTVNPDTKADEIISMMFEHHFRHVPVTENNKPVGIISQRDIIQKLRTENAGATTAKDMMTPEPYQIYENTPIEEVAFHMSDHKFGCALVLDESGELAGIFTTTDALNALVEVVRGDIQ